MIMNDDQHEEHDNDDYEDDSGIIYGSFLSVLFFSSLPILLLNPEVLQKFCLNWVLLLFSFPKTVQNRILSIERRIQQNQHWITSTWVKWEKGRGWRQDLSWVDDVSWNSWWSSSVSFSTIFLFVHPLLFLFFCYIVRCAFGWCIGRWWLWRCKKRLKDYEEANGDYSDDDDAVAAGNIWKRRIAVMPFADKGIPLWIFRCVFLTLNSIISLM